MYIVYGMGVMPMPVLIFPNKTNWRKNDKK